MLAALALAFAGLVAGLTGTWSPCGFSMIDTLGPAGHPGGRRRTVAACAAFALGAPLGGAITFGALAAVGSALQGGGAALGVAVVVAAAAATLDAGGVPVAPQLRRQVPESWRRRLPLPVAGFLYGLLLGLGFTTFVLAFALPALAAVSVAVADLGLGLVLGVSFGVGRALPIVVLAPLADSEAGARAITAMAERPALLRGARAADALALAAVAAVLALGGADAARAAAPPGGGVEASAGTTTTSAHAARTRCEFCRPLRRKSHLVATAASSERRVAAITGGEASAGGPRRVAVPATDPSADGGALAWSIPGGDARLSADGAVTPLGGRDAALGGGRLALVAPDGTVVVTERATGAALALAAPGADALAVSARWLAWRAPGPDRILVADLADPAAPSRIVATASGAGTLSRPSLDGDRLVWAAATTRGSTIASLDLATPAAAVTLRHGRRGEVLAEPTVRGDRLLYVRLTNLRQQLVLGRAEPGAGGRTLLRLRGVGGRDGGRGHGRTGQGRRPEDRNGRIRPARRTLHATALDDAFAYVTRVPRRGGRADIVRVPR